MTFEGAVERGNDEGDICRSTVIPSSHPTMLARQYNSRPDGEEYIDELGFVFSKRVGSRELPCLEGTSLRVG